MLARRRGASVAKLSVQARAFLRPMSALGQKQTFAVQNGMSALPLIADMCSATRYVCFGPKADIRPLFNLAKI